MAAGPYQHYVLGLEKIHDSTIALETDPLQALLLDDAHTVDLNAHEFVDAVVGDEVSGGGYARVSLANSTVSVIANESVHNFDNISFGSNVTIAARYIVIFVNTGNDATSRLVYICDLNTGGGNLSSSNGAFDINTNANGAHKIVPNQ